MNVLSPRVHPSEGRQRTGVYRYQSHAHYEALHANSRASSESFRARSAATTDSTARSIASAAAITTARAPASTAACTSLEPAAATRQRDGGKRRAAAAARTVPELSPTQEHSRWPVSP